MELIPMWNHLTSHIGISTALEGYTTSIRPTFRWTPYEDPTIQAVILNEFFQNPNIWHVVLLFNYATMEMHQTDKVLQQFRFRQLIPVTPKVLDDEHKIDLRQLNTD
ncbi:hypothetical protein J1N35_044342 [Gossypium stocksii]|uniref:Uncharacterized protein n=1 Tax=Gossypium stocksii TaxID=47602 RepID=A0A9D3ZGA4_9ROSI|nr:hypothetical protein J1N35_044342 [Gossypium stocksii]